MSSKQTSLVFPCRFTIKVMGRGDSDEFENSVNRILRRHLPALNEDDISRRDSRQGNYAALSIVFDADSREQLDAIYRELSACEHVVMAL